MNSATYGSMLWETKDPLTGTGKPRKIWSRRQSFTGETDNHLCQMWRFDHASILALTPFIADMMTMNARLTLSLMPFAREKKPNISIFRSIVFFIKQKCTLKQTQLLTHIWGIFIGKQKTISLKKIIIICVLQYLRIHTI